ncbi:MAG: hypothetical protein JOS17DRAFT_377307 [Linnemannia elongata]|nr:MAG: hypothetical protein JOS17DRAFT_377307 [Linnemannia elongata]
MVTLNQYRLFVTDLFLLSGMYSLLSRYTMTIQLRLGVSGDITAANAVVCAKCCYNLGGDFMPYINGTHLINGTDIFPVSPLNVGFGFGNDSVILPCALNYHVGTVYYQPSSSPTITPKMYLLVLGLVAFVLVGM